MSLGESDDIPSFAYLTTALTMPEMSLLVFLFGFIGGLVNVAFSCFWQISPLF